jgi:hypothetical protein
MVKKSIHLLRISTPAPIPIDPEAKPIVAGKTGWYCRYVLGLGKDKK